MRAGYTASLRLRATVARDRTGSWPPGDAGLV